MYIINVYDSLERSIVLKYFEWWFIPSQYLVYILGRIPLAWLVEAPLRVQAITRQSSVVQTPENTVRSIRKTYSNQKAFIIISINIFPLWYTCGSPLRNYILVYVDSSERCNDLSFQLGATASGVTEIATRKWSIKVESNWVYISFFRQ